MRRLTVTRTVTQNMFLGKRLFSEERRHRQVAAGISSEWPPTGQEGLCFCFSPVPRAWCCVSKVRGGALAGAVDLSYSAGTDQREYFVGAEALLGLERHFPRQICGNITLRELQTHAFLGCRGCNSEALCLLSPHVLDGVLSLA